MTERETVRLDMLAGELAGQLGTEPAGTRVVLDAFLGLMRDHLAEDAVVELDDFLEMSVDEQPTEGDRPAAALLAVRPHRKLRKAVERKSSGTIVVVVKEADFFTDLLVEKLGSTGHAVKVLEEGDDLHGRIVELGADVLVIDSQVDGADSACRKLKGDRETSLVSIIMLYPEGTDPETFDTFRICPNEAVVEPYDIDELGGVVDAELVRIIETQRASLQEVRYQITSADEGIEQGNDFMVELIGQSGLPQTEAEGLAVSFRESLDNACRHGNHNQPDKICDIIYILDREKITITVEDEGEGFDTEAYLETGIEGDAVEVARKRYKAGQVGGLGIMMMLNCVDDMEYNYAGNKLRLTKFVRKPA